MSIKYLTTNQQTQAEPRALSGGVLRREGHHIQQGGDTMQKRLHGAGAWQMEAAAVLVLFDLCGDLEEGHDDRRGLGLRERGMVWCKVAVRKAWWRRYAAHASSN